MIDDDEKRIMMRAHSIGPRMITYLEHIGITGLRDLRNADPELLAMRINTALGKHHINRTGVKALANLVALADREAPDSGE